MGYYGVRYNRSRFVGLGEMLLGISCIGTAIPYFIYGPMDLTSNVASLVSTSLASSNNTLGQMCPADSVDLQCFDNQGATVWPAVIILFWASFFRGAGFTVFFVIAMPYLDDNVSKAKSPMFLGIMQAILLLGPATGFMVSAYFLNLYEDPWSMFA